MTTLNVPLFIKAKKHILDEPQRLRMDQWFMQDEPGKDRFNPLPGYNEPNHYIIPKCGTVGCIAGWVVYLGLTPQLVQEVKDDPFQSYENRAENLLGIDSNISPYNIWFVDQWPQPFRDEFLEAELHDGDQQLYRAQIVGRVIDHFIEAYQDAEKTYNEAQ